MEDLLGKVLGGGRHGLGLTSCVRVVVSGGLQARCQLVGCCVVSRVGWGVGG